MRKGRPLATEEDATRETGEDAAVVVGPRVWQGGTRKPRNEVRQRIGASGKTMQRRAAGGLKGGAVKTTGSWSLGKVDSFQEL